MLKKPILKILLSIVSFFIVVGLFLINSNTVNITFLSQQQKQVIKKYVFPYHVISQQEQIISQQEQIISQQTISQQEQIISQQEQLFSERDELRDVINNLALNLELNTKESLKNIKTKKEVINLSKNLQVDKYYLLTGFYFGINIQYPGSGYIDFYKDNLIILSSRGVLAFAENFENRGEFKQIKNNIDDFIGLEQYEKNNWFSIKDLLVSDDKVYVSFTEELKDNCWNTSIIFGNMNYEEIIFKKLFSADECIHSTNNTDKDFNAHQSGGRIISFDKNHILLTTGEYRSRHLAQDEASLNGKVLKINIVNGNYEIISMGHRNPQGLFFDKDNNIILETEHGPQGGDEINIIEVSKISQDTVQNYGWAISSAGEHYPGVIQKNPTIYEKYPLHKSHSEFGFIEPIKSFVPSIGISEIVKIDQNKYVVSSLKGKSIYFFELGGQNKIINFEQIEVFERIRDLKYKNNRLYLFMEDSASIGIVNISDF
tara:strand:- start:10995 stop:12452 length:1458 start_codon:yes stop_codon:yes gene_type:complete